MKRIQAWMTFVAGALMLAASASDAATTVDCTFGEGSERISRGFYVSNYAGTTIERVAIAHSAEVAGERTIALTARLDTFDGTSLGVATVTRTLTTANSLSVFDFGRVAVPAGSRITFTQTLIAGAGPVYFDTGVGPCVGVTETEDTTAPLSTFRKAAVGIVIAGDPASIADAMTLDCPFDPFGSGDRVDRGFYVTNYRGVTIDTVRLRHSAADPGFKTITLIARLNRYDGPLVGIASVTRSVSGSMTESVFDFGGAAAPAGSTITFEQVLTAGTGLVFFDLGFETCDGVVETQDVVPPLSTVRRDKVGAKITGRVASDLPIPVVEYYHTVFGHYFMTADADEIYGLDHGAYGGVFVRTGQRFHAFDGPAPNTADVCRFFTVTFAPKSSHFYTGDPVECGGVKANPDWQYEKLAFFITAAPGGACRLYWTPVYRMYNDGMTGAPNHRFTTDVSIYNDFTTNRGWIPEGVRFCEPPA